MKQKILTCEVCKKKKNDVRFESNEEKYICDSCLSNVKRIEELKEEVERLENLGDYETKEYDDYIDDVYSGEQLVNIYGASRILKEVDEICYNMGKTEYYENKIYELNEELQELEGKK